MQTTPPGYSVALMQGISLMESNLQNGEINDDSTVNPGMNPAIAILPEVYVLDIDGTLMQTHEIDNTCYWDAVGGVFGIEPDSRDLLDYRHISDSGILDQWCRHTLGRPPSTDETFRLRQSFLDLLQEVSYARPELFQPRAGLVEWLDRMEARPNTYLAVATGSWGNTAEFKLAFSGLDRYRLTLASADDAMARTEIMLTALGRLALPTPPTPARITYIGDGPWDFEASRALGWTFIGIADGHRARRLTDLGATYVLEDFRPLNTGALESVDGNRPEQRGQEPC